jgi:hypothetical protein
MKKFFYVAALAAVAMETQGAPDLSPVVIREETVATCLPAGNGAGPLWCYGAPLLFGTARRSSCHGDRGIEPL